MANDTGNIDWGNLLGQGAGALAGYLGNRSATNNVVGGQQNAINTQTRIQGTLQGIYGPQRGLGNLADAGLGAQLGLFGTPDYSAFNNSPGFKFAEQQGDLAINRQAAANGSLYTPNTMAMLSQYNTGYASQNYNNYINQLMQAAGIGAQGNAGLGSSIYGTGANISQLQQNQGNALAGGSANTSGIASNLISKLPWGAIGSGVGGLVGGGSANDPSNSARTNWFGGDGSSNITNQWNGSPG